MKISCSLETRSGSIVQGGKNVKECDGKTGKLFRATRDQAFSLNTWRFNDLVCLCFAITWK